MGACVLVVRVKCQDNFPGPHMITVMIIFVIQGLNKVLVRLIIKERLSETSKSKLF